MIESSPTYGASCSGYAQGNVIFVPNRVGAERGSRSIEFKPIMAVAPGECSKRKHKRHTAQVPPDVCEALARKANHIFRNIYKYWVLQETYTCWPTDTTPQASHRSLGITPSLPLRRTTCCTRCVEIFPDLLYSDYAVANWDRLTKAANLIEQIAAAMARQDTRKACQDILSRASLPDTSK